MELKTRRCLKCRRDFEPRHQFNFICKQCTEGNKKVRNYLKTNKGRRRLDKELENI